jgi:predicted Rossmann fold nucleotide-binding protein DprA/Smf involved in DNA uptake
MSEAKRDWQKDLKILRERVGCLSEEKKAWAKEQRDTLKAISQALGGGPATIQEIAARTALPGEKVVWLVMAMKRYGKITECGRAGDCYLYGWKGGAA